MEMELPGNAAFKMVAFADFSIRAARPVSDRSSDRDVYKRQAVCGGCACSKWNEKIRRTFCSPTCALRHSDLPVFELYMDEMCIRDSPLVDCSRDGWNRLDLWACVEKRNSGKER